MYELKFYYLTTPTPFFLIYYFIQEVVMYTMSNEHLITSIIEIWALTQFHDLDTWTINPAWYNWVILDISRRINHLGNRNNAGILINHLITLISMRLFCEFFYFSLFLKKNLLFFLNIVDSCPENNEIDGIRFDKYPLFCSKKRARLILLATTYGDSVCGLSEFIDFLHILHMSDDEFDFFFKDLQKPKWNIRYRIQLMANLFQSEDPSRPFS